MYPLRADQTIGTGRRERTPEQEEMTERKAGEKPIRKRNRIPPADKSFAYGNKRENEHPKELHSLHGFIICRNSGRGNPINRTHGKTEKGFLGEMNAKRNAKGKEISDRKSGVQPNKTQRDFRLKSVKNDSRSELFGINDPK